MPDKFDATDIATIIEQTDILIEWKIQLYPDIKYVIISHNLAVADNMTITLDVNTIKI